jgi:type I restriction enzyme, S subunit
MSLSDPQTCGAHNVAIRSLAKAEAESLEVKLSALDRNVEELFVEIQVLGHLRDTLLPRLMSGEIRVQEAEKIVEDAT